MAEFKNKASVVLCTGTKSSASAVQVWRCYESSCWWL